MLRTTKVIFINVNSVVSRQRRHNLQLFADSVKPDVLLLAETKLSNRHKFGLNGYTTYRKDRTDRTGGGTAICIREGMWSEKICIDTSGVENTAARIRGRSGSTITLVALYDPPRVVL